MLTSKSVVLPHNSGATRWKNFHRLEQTSHLISTSSYIIIYKENEIKWIVWSHLTRKPFHLVAPRLCNNITLSGSL